MIEKFRAMQTTDGSTTDDNYEELREADLTLAHQEAEFDYDRFIHTRVYKVTQGDQEAHFKLTYHAPASDEASVNNEWWYSFTEVQPYEEEIVEYER